VKVMCLVKSIELLVWEEKFRFEKWWIQRAYFGDLVRKAWSSKCPHSEPLERWQFKIRIVRRMIRDGQLM
jgi:hypothetical protein